MEKKSRSQTRLIILFVALACLLWVGSSQAQDYPKGSVQIVIPYSPGGLTDIFWRTISEDLAGISRVPWLSSISRVGQEWWVPPLS